MEKQTAKKIDRRCKRTKQAITSAMLALMQEKPVAAITVSELALRADINRKTFYKHYRDTAAVLDEIEGELIERIFSNFNRENVMLDIEDPYPFLRQIGESMRREGERIRILIDVGEDTRFSQRLDQAVSDMLDTFLKHNTSVDPVVFRFFTTFLGAGLRFVYVEVLMGRTDVPIERYNEMIAELIGHAKKMLHPAPAR